MQDLQDKTIRELAKDCRTVNRKRLLSPWVRAANSPL